MGRVGRPLSAYLSPCLSFSALPTCVNNSRLERHEERVAKGRKVDSDEGHRQEELRQLDLGESPLRDQCDRVAAARLVDHCTDEKRAHTREPGARQWMQRFRVASLLLTVNADDAKLRANRLSLLARLTAATARVADFSKLEG